MREPAGESGADRDPPSQTHLSAAAGSSTRRDFFITLGTGAAAGIAGYFLVQRAFSPLPASLDDGTGPTRPPCLKEDVVFGNDGDMVTVSLSGGGSPVVCAANRPGQEVLTRLDGRHTIEEMSRAVAAAVGVSRTEALDAKVAHFVAQVGMLGFLREPFFACIVEEVDA